MLDVASHVQNLGEGAMFKLAVFKLVDAVTGTVPSGEQAEFSKQCSELSEQAKAPELIRKLLGQSEAILALDNPGDVEGMFVLLFSLLHKTEDAVAAMPVLAVEIGEALTSKQDGRAALRLKLATQLYNMLPSRNPGQLELLLIIIRFAAEAGLLSMLSSFFEGVEDWIKERELNVTDQRRLLILVADVLEETGQNNDSQRFLLKYLATFEGAPREELVSVKGAAARCAVGAVKAPIVSFTDKHNLLGLQAVEQLQGDPQHSSLYELLRIFAEGKLVDYTAYLKANQATLTSAGISHDNCVANMRLLSLCSLAAEHEEVPYAAVAETLQVDLEDVEEWVLLAIGSGLMEAKMDQLRQVVVISRCVNRVFGKEQWLALQKKLRTWSQNVEAMLATVQRTNDLYAKRASGGQSQMGVNGAGQGE
ncbi:unnamed protein product [Chrysoparadoxa australica]